MKVYIFDPIWEDLVTSELLNQLTSVGIEILVKKNCANYRLRRTVTGKRT